MKKHMKILSLALLLALCLSGCGKTEDVQTDTTTTTVSDTTTTTAAQTTQPPAPADAALYLVEYGNTTYSVIRPDEASDAITKGASTLYQKIKAKTGTTLKLNSDWYNTRVETPDLDGPEILVGETNRPESAEVLAALPENS